MKKLLLISLTLFSCNNKTSEQQFLEEKQRVVDYYNNINMEYFIDKNTKLCFAKGKYDINSGYGFATNVPCTPEVMNVVINK